MASKLSMPTASTAGDYRVWRGNLKTRFRPVKTQAAMAVNTALLQFYWELGADIVAQQASQRWGIGFLDKLSQDQDLMQEFPDMKGFSKRNLKQIRRWYGFWSTTTERDTKICLIHTWIFPHCKIQLAHSKMA